MGRIFIVEDNTDLALLYRRAFHGHDITWKETAWDAIATLEKDQAFDLIVLDMHLPEVSGLVVLQHIRKMPEGKQMNVFAISADDNMRGKAELIGIQHWMTKPVELDILIDVANRYLKKDTEPKKETEATPEPEVKKETKV